MSRTEPGSWEENLLHLTAEALDEGQADDLTRLEATLPRDPADADRELERLPGRAQRLARRSRHQSARTLYEVYLRHQTAPSREQVAARIDLYRLVLRPTGDFEEGQAALEQATREARGLGATDLEVRALRYQARLLYHLGRPSRALACCQEALAAARRLGDEGEQLLVQSIMVLVLPRLDRQAEARELAREILPRARTNGDERVLARVASRVGNTIHRQDGLLLQARDLVLEAVTILRRLDQPRSLSGELTILATIERDLGELELAGQHLEEALRIAQESGDVPTETFVLTSIGGLRFACRQPGAARAAYERALELCHRTGDRQNIAILRGNLGVVHLALGDPVQAAALYRETIDRTGEEADLPLRRRATCNLARLQRLIWGHLEEAAALLDQVEASYREHRAQLGLLHCICEQGFVQLAGGEPAGATLERAVEQALTLGVTRDSVAYAIVAMLERAVAAHAAGERLVRGSCPRDLPLGVRRWLHEQGVIQEQDLAEPDLEHETLLHLFVAPC